MEFSSLGFHKAAREPKRAFQGPCASNTTKILREGPPREEKRMNIVAGEGGPAEGVRGRGPGGGRRDPWEVSNGGGAAERGLEKKRKRKREINKGKQKNNKEKQQNGKKKN